MADELLVFEQTVEAVFARGLHGRIPPSCKARLRQAGLDLDQKLRTAYPLDTWMTFLRIPAQELYPDAPLEQGAFKLGEAFIDGLSGYDGHACTYCISWSEASVSSGVAGKGDSRAATRSGSISSR